MTLTLANAPKGKALKIQTFIDKKMSNYFRELGLIEHAIVSIERIAPLGDPVVINISGALVSFRKSDLKNIIVELINE
jgi:ferrous iron transport protein A